MSSGFVSAGGDEVKPREGLADYDEDAWAKARQKIEEIKKPKPEAIGTQEGGKSLYEHLQAQKAAKQEAFEEATKLRNQFRPLDDSEVEFLESIRRKEQTQAMIERRETEEQLEAFRKERVAAEEKAREQEALLEDKKDVPGDASQIWTTTKKRRRPGQDDHSGASKAVKKTDDNLTKPAEKEGTLQTNQKVATTKRPTSPAPAPVSAETHRNPMASLVAYDSDSDN